MAYDKVVDSAVLDANLTSVANAIRSKGGTTASLAFPSGFADAISAIKTGGNLVVKTITIASELTNTTKTLLTGDAFVKEHYGCDGFSAVLIPVDCASIANSTNAYIPFVYQGNRGMIKTGSNIYYGVMLRGGSSSAGVQGNTIKLSGTGWNVSLRAQSSGNLVLYVSSSFKIPVGTYNLVLYCDE
jgi:hypothetical protein